MGAERLAGTPWHIERVKKEHKRPCKFFNDEDHWCLKRNKQCYRSVHCEYYQPLNPEQHNEEPAKKKPIDQSQKIVIGSTVRHREYGNGIVQKIDEKMITVRFVQNGLRTVYKDTCVPHRQVETNKGQVSSQSVNRQKNSSIRTSERIYMDNDPNPIESDTMSKFYPGQSVVHKKFGKGVIKSRKLGDMKVEFEDFGEKELQLDICIKEKLLTIPSDTHAD